MATVRDGHRRALLVVDAQVGVWHQCWEAERVLDGVKAAVAAAREAGIPVIWVQHSDEELRPGSGEWALMPGLQPQHGEARIGKLFNSAFEQSTLDQELAMQGVTHLVLAGAASNWCIRATAYGALDRGYDLTLLSDAHTTRDMVLDDGEVVRANDVVRELNTSMRWVRYPGRRNEVCEVADVAWLIG